MSVEAVDKSLDRRFVEVTQVGSALSWFLAQHQGLGVDKSECVNDNLALDGLYGVNNDGDGSRRKLFEALLGVDIDRRQPASESRVRVVPSDDRFRSTKQLVKDRIMKHGGWLTAPFASTCPSSSAETPGRQLRH